MVFVYSQFSHLARHLLYRMLRRMECSLICFCRRTENCSRTKDEYRRIVLEEEYISIGINGDAGKCESM